MPTLEQSRRTVDAYAQQQANMVGTLLRILFGLWGGFNHWGRPDLVRAHAARSTVEVDLAMSQVRGLTRAYMLARLGQIDAAPARLPELVDTYERGGVPQVQVYQRPARERSFVERRELANGAPPEEAAEKADKAFVARLRAIVEEDAAATARDEADRVMAAAPKVIGYRRIIRPELSQTGTCALCVVAATRIYTVGELMPIHAHCKCTVDAITADSDPGFELNEADMRVMLDRLYDEAGGNSGEQLKNVRIKSYEHGELGPILIRQGSKFRTLEEVNRDTKNAPKATPFTRMTRADDQINWRAMKATSERSIRYLLNAKSRGSNLVDISGTGDPVRIDDIDAAIQYHRDLISRAARHAA